MRSGSWRLLVCAGSLIVMAELAGACVPMTVHSYLEPGAELRRYRTFSWGPADTWSTGDPRLDNNRFFDDRVRARVEAELQRRGFEKTASEPDLYLHYHMNVAQDVQYGSLDHQDECAKAGCGPQVYEKGTLVVDLVDARNRKVVWRGWAEGVIEGVVDNQSWMESRIDDVVTRIFQGFNRES